MSRGMCEYMAIYARRNNIAAGILQEMVRVLLLILLDNLAALYYYIRLYVLKLQGT